MRADLAGWFERLSASFEQAQERAACVQRQVLVDTVGVRLALAGSELEAAVLPALSHLPALDPRGEPAVVFAAWDHASTGVAPPPPPFAAGEYHHFGHRAVHRDERWAVMHSPGAQMLHAYDRETGRGYFWCQEAADCTIYDRAAPLQPLFAWALAEFGWRIVHAAAVGTERGGVLLVGNSGSGKSTTALSCLAGGRLKFLADDKCLLRLEPHPRAFALYSAAKLKLDMLERLPLLRPLVAAWDERSNPWKGLLFLEPRCGDRLIASFPVEALLLPCARSGERAATTPISPGRAFRHLGPSTVIWMAGVEAESYRFAAEVARRLPAHRLELAAEPRANAAAIDDLLGGRP